jgi:hypothetical protein
VCTCGSDGNAIVWKADTANESSTKRSYTQAFVLPHGDSQIYACETLACIPAEHVMTAAEDQLHMWDLSGGGRDVPIKSLNFEVTDSTPGECNLLYCRLRRAIRDLYLCFFFVLYHRR